MVIKYSLAILVILNLSGGQMTLSSLLSSSHYGAFIFRGALVN